MTIEEIISETHNQSRWIIPSNLKPDDTYIIALSALHSIHNRKLIEESMKILSQMSTSPHGRGVLDELDALETCIEYCSSMSFLTQGNSMKHGIRAISRLVKDATDVRVLELACDLIRRLMHLTSPLSESILDLLFLFGIFAQSPSSVQYIVSTSTSSSILKAVAKVEDMMDARTLMVPMMENESFRTIAHEFVSVSLKRTQPCVYTFTRLVLKRSNVLLADDLIRQIIVVVANTGSHLNLLELIQKENTISAEQVPYILILLGMWEVMGARTTACLLNLMREHGEEIDDGILESISIGFDENPDILVAICNLGCEEMVTQCHESTDIVDLMTAHPLVMELQRVGFKLLGMMNNDSTPENFVEHVLVTLNRFPTLFDDAAMLLVGCDTLPSEYNTRIFQTLLDAMSSNSDLNVSQILYDFILKKGIFPSAEQAETLFCEMEARYDDDDCYRLMWLIAANVDTVDNRLYRILHDVLPNSWEHQRSALHTILHGTEKEKNSLLLQWMMPLRVPPPSPRMQGVCVLCMEKQSVMAIIPCGHQIACKECIDGLTIVMDACPICRTEIDEFIQIFIP